MTWASLNEWICLSYTHSFCARHFNSKALHSQFPFGGISISSNFFSIVESSFIRQMCPTSADTRFKSTKSITWKIEWKSEHTNALCENIFMTNSFATNWFGYGTDWMPGEFMCIFVLSSINWSRRRATEKNTHTVFLFYFGKFTLLSLCHLIVPFISQLVTLPFRFQFACEQQIQ